MPRVHCTTETFLVDTVTPVSVYLRVRDRYAHSLLLESADYRGQAGSWSFVCAKPRAEFRVTGDEIIESYPDGSTTRETFTTPRAVPPRLEAFVAAFMLDGAVEKAPLAAGLFGYLAYDSIEYFEEITLTQPEDERRSIPRILYKAYEYVLAFNHSKNEMHLMHHSFNASSGPPDNAEHEFFRSLARPGPVPELSFSRSGDETSNFSDAEYCGIIDSCKKHIFRGDVFQIVPSRRFEQPFHGDDFLAYRALRSINPSPYLFYFDFGSFRIFGSSPEAQLIVKGGRAEVHPIAGTYRRTGDERYDAERAQALLQDEKENAEHVMLVDLARNDLSIHCTEVRVDAYREVQYYSHIIHLVSKVSGLLRGGNSTVAVLGATFPAGTLSGAPKYRAMEIIDRYERGRRYFYGGAIGMLGFDGRCNHAIMIRSFLSKKNSLFCQAGGGVVADSSPAAEAQEANNKLMALKAALVRAEELSSGEGR